jgi:hypothetical protein
MRVQFLFNTKNNNIKTASIVTTRDLLSQSVDSFLRVPHLVTNLLQFRFQPGHSIFGQSDVRFEQVGIVLGADAAHRRVQARPGGGQVGQSVVEVVVLVLGQHQPLRLDMVDVLLGLETKRKISVVPTDERALHAPDFYKLDQVSRVTKRESAVTVNHPTALRI